MAARGHIEFNENRCKGCELCVFACPKKIIKISETAVNAMGYHPAGIEDMEGCTACANCAMMCPDGAIRVCRDQ